MNIKQKWTAKRIHLTEDGYLVIDAEPRSDNRKRCGGEMEFYLLQGQLNELLKQVEEGKATERLIEVAASEMKEFLELFKAEYHEKKRTLAEQLNLNVEDIPKPCWYGLDDPNEAMQVLRNYI